MKQPEGFKKCSNCFTIKAVTEFYPRMKDSPYLSQRYQSRCKGCNAEVVRGYYARKHGRKIEWADEDLLPIAVR